MGKPCLTEVTLRVEETALLKAVLSPEERASRLTWMSSNSYTTTLDKIGIYTASVKARSARGTESVAEDPSVEVTDFEAMNTVELLTETGERYIPANGHGGSPRTARLHNQVP